LAAVWRWLREGQELHPIAAVALDSRPTLRPTAQEVVAAVRGGSAAQATTSEVEVVSELASGSVLLPPGPARAAADLNGRKRLDEKTALGLMSDVARALTDAHRRGIVHRDIKPENVLVVEGDGGPRAKLSDFGLARHVHETPSLHVTRTGAVVGTPLYMSPE